MMRAAELEEAPFAPLPFGIEECDEAAAQRLLKEQVAERLASHRSRRGGVTRVSGLAVVESAARRVAKNERSSQIAAAVAERYAQSASYRDFLAAEAQRAIVEAQAAADEARAAAEVAARSAEAVAVAQQQFLADLGSWPEPVESAMQETAQDAVAPVAREASRSPVAELSVRLYEEAGDLKPGLWEPEGRAFYAGFAASGRPAAAGSLEVEEDEHLALDEEIAFRQAPVFEEPPTPVEAIPGNLLEFPRQLVAARRARPRLAEGPLWDEADGVPDAAQLRIFEVEAGQISAAPVVEGGLPEWASIHLDTMRPEAAAALQPEAAVGRASRAEVFAAPVGVRAMAACVDLCVVAMATIGLLAAAATVAGSVPRGAVAALCSVGVLALLTLLYQALFLTLAEATPGMRYARIAFCTFGDENPTRSAIRRRLPALMVAVVPAALGLIWIWLDEDRLGWHDRLSGIYQRSY